MELTQTIYIGLAGRAGVGKSTLAKHIASHLAMFGVFAPVQELSFAAELKSMVAATFNISLAAVEEAKGRQLGRWILEQIGTHYLGETELVDLMEARCRLLPEKVIAIFTDVRKISEVKFIQDRGGVVIKIHRPEPDKREPYPTEAELGSIPFDIPAWNDRDGMAAMSALSKDLTKQILTHHKICTYLTDQPTSSK